MGSEGDAVALEASERTGYRLIYTHTIGKLARRHGLQGGEWRWMDQDWYRLFAQLEDRSHVHLADLRPALLDAATDRRGALFVGRGIEELLRGHVPLLSVHVVAPFETRVERIMRQVNIMRSRAEERVRRSDEENAWFYHYFFHVHWADPDRYDLIFDTSILTPHECAQQLAKTMAQWSGPDDLTPRGSMGNAGRYDL
jgi:cytidylate kinase